MLVFFFLRRERKAEAVTMLLSYISGSSNFVLPTSGCTSNSEHLTQLFIFYFPQKRHWWKRNRYKRNFLSCIFVRVGLSCKDTSKVGKHLPRSLLSDNSLLDVVSSAASRKLNCATHANAGVAFLWHCFCKPESSFAFATLGHRSTWRKK